MIHNNIYIYIYIYTYRNIDRYFVKNNIASIKKYGGDDGCMDSGVEEE